MQAKFFLAVAAFFAPLVVASPMSQTDENSALKERKMDPLFEIMAWKEGLEEILRNAANEKAHSDGGKKDNGWSHPIWPYE